MFLRELHVENVRAIRRASVRLESTTTLIGENGSGCGSLIRALELVLGSAGEARPVSADFHRGPGGAAPSEAMRVTLVFEERTPGEWGDAWPPRLAAHLPRAATEARRLVLDASGPPPLDTHAAELSVRVTGLTEEATQRDVVEYVLATNPLIRVAGGLLTGHSWGSAERFRAHSQLRPAEPVASLVDQILRSADALLSGSAADLEECIDVGARAARQLLAQSPRHFDPIAGGLAHSVLEILGGPPTPASPRSEVAAPEPSALADRLGTLLLLAALLRRMPGGLAPGVEPLWVIEDPEAHLHPMTLVSTQRLLERIRWQKILTTQSGDLLSAMPLSQIRRVVRHEGEVRVAGLRPRALSREHLRRLGYHLRVHRGVAMFARVWLLVEGESEFWVLPQVAQVMGYDLALEGICCVGFAQCGIDPLVRAAREFGIEWHLLADGDDAGRRYVDAARPYMHRGDEPDRVTLLPDRDIEHCFWHNGHADTILAVAGLPPDMEPRVKPTQAISKAVQRRSKPFLALRLVESVAKQGPTGVPPPVARLVETCVRLARTAPRRACEIRRQAR